MDRGERGSGARRQGGLGEENTRGGRCPRHGRQWRRLHAVDTWRRPPLKNGCRGPGGAGGERESEVHDAQAEARLGGTRGPGAGAAQAPRLNERRLPLDKIRSAPREACCHMRAVGRGASDDGAVGDVAVLDDHHHAVADHPAVVLGLERLLWGAGAQGTAA